MNLYFVFSIISFGLIFVVHVSSLFFLGAAQAFDGMAQNASVFHVTFHGLPLWMIQLFLFTFGIFFLIFGVKKRLQKKQPV